MKTIADVSILKGLKFTPFNLKANRLYIAETADIQREYINGYALSYCTAPFVREINMRTVESRTDGRRTTDVSLSNRLVSFRDVVARSEMTAWTKRERTGAVPANPAGRCRRLFISRAAI